MAGLLTHVLVSLGGFTLIYLVFKKFWMGLVFFFGHLAPDLMSFGTIGLLNWKFHPKMIIIQDNFFLLHHFFNSFLNWFWICIAGVVLLLLLFRFKFISKTKLSQGLFWVVALFVSTYLHIILDIFIKEANRWI